MSTRCQIGIYTDDKKALKDYSALLYKHCDGYPEGVLPVIEPFLKDFAFRRGLDDIEYLAAWLLYEIMNDHVEHNKEMSKAYPSVSATGKDYLGHGICTKFYAGIEYYYAVTPTQIRVYDVPFDSNPTLWKVMQVVDLRVTETV